nr:MAG TPA: hypothetical protein [Caudoviricetes sp.]
MLFYFSFVIFILPYKYIFFNTFTHKIVYKYMY